jgi:hypothetical protein
VEDVEVSVIAIKPIPEEAYYLTWARYYAEHRFIVSEFRVAEFRKQAVGRVDFFDREDHIDRRYVIFEKEDDVVLWQMAF